MQQSDYPYVTVPALIEEGDYLLSWFATFWTDPRAKAVLSIAKAVLDAAQHISLTNQGLQWVCDEINAITKAQPPTV